MKKIPTVLVRDPDDRAHVLDQVTPGCEWVLNGEGNATRKYDGTCVMFDGTDWWARRELKPGKPQPFGYRKEEFDPVTGKTVGWEPMAQSPFAKFHEEASTLFPGRSDYAKGTYELVGPKINGNPEGYDHHELIEHSNSACILPRGDSLSIRDLRILVIGCGDNGWEGIVWHHPDGRMAKLKARDMHADYPVPA